VVLIDQKLVTRGLTGRFPCRQETCADAAEPERVCHPTAMPHTVLATVKWGKERFNVVLTVGGRADDLKHELYTLTRVPVERQKVMCPKAWKGALKDGTIFGDELVLKSGEKELIIMLMGSAEAAPTAPDAPVVFAEDISPEAAAAADADAAAEALAAAEGMIPALQFVPGPDRAESKALMSNMPIKYNHFAHGLPQVQIEQTLRQQRDSGGHLLDVCAMTFGHELGKAYVNGLACLQVRCLRSFENRHRVPCLHAIHLLHATRGYSEITPSILGHSLMARTLLTLNRMAPWQVGVITAASSCGDMARGCERSSTLRRWLQCSARRQSQ
jgi:hypothetical protein